MLDISPAPRLAAFVTPRAAALVGSNRPGAAACPTRPTESPAMPRVTLRPWRPSDLEACVRLWRAGSEAGHPFLGREALDADEMLVRVLYMPSADITVAEEAGAVIGFIAMAGSFIGALFVTPSRHREGIGARLLAHVARRHPVLEVEAYVANAAARSFYASCGFEEILCLLRDDQGRPHPLVRLRRTGSGQAGRQSADRV